MLSILQSASAAATRRFVTNVPGRVLTRCRHETGGFPHFAATSLSVDNARRVPHISFWRTFTTDKDGEIVDIPLPPIGDSIDRGFLASWEKSIGDYCAEDEVIAIVDTDKISFDVQTPVGGELVETLVEDGDDIEIGQVMARVKVAPMPADYVPQASSASAQKPASAEPAPATSSAATNVSPMPAPATPAAQPASQAAPARPPPQKEKPATSTTAPVSPSEAPSSVGGGREERLVKMTPIRRTTAKRLKESQETTAALTTFNEIDMSRLMAMRSRHKDGFFAKHGVKLGFMSAFVAAATKALQEVPAVNGTIKDDHILYHEYVDISIAVSSPRGLVVPVLRNCESMSFAQIEANIAELGRKAQENAITLEEMAGGTFTISNGGVFGSMMSTPMINLPQSAILGMHNIVERPVARNGEVVIRPVMYVALTYDHRLIDGRESVTFLKSIKEKIEDPERMLLDL